MLEAKALLQLARENVTNLEQVVEGTQRRIEALFSPEIDLDRALAPIRGMEISGVEMAPLRRLDEGRAPAARIVPAAFTLDLNDVGTQVGENLPGPGPGQDTGKLEYA